MKILTREQAIKRIKDIYKLSSVSHLDDLGTKEPMSNRETFLAKAHQKLGAIKELMAIFHIKEEELK